MDLAACAPLDYLRRRMMRSGIRDEYIMGLSEEDEMLTLQQLLDQICVSQNHPAEPS